jgi:hypothetical protein
MAPLGFRPGARAARARQEFKADDCPRLAADVPKMSKKPPSSAGNATVSMMFGTEGRTPKPSARIDAGEVEGQNKKWCEQEPPFSRFFMSKLISTQ